MNGDQGVNASIKAIIEECSTRVIEEDLEGIPHTEKFRVISYEAGLFSYIVARAARRKRVITLDGSLGAGSITAWLAGAVNETDGELVSWELNSRRHLKLQNLLTRARLSHRVEIIREDPVLTRMESGIENFMIGGMFDLAVISMLERDWKELLEIAVNILEIDGLLLITDTMQVNEADQKDLNEMLERLPVVVVGLETGEGAALGIKHDSIPADRRVTDEFMVGSQAAGRLHELEKGNREPGSRFWAISPVTGRFFWILLSAMKPGKALEIGASSGYSGIWISSAIKPHGGLLTTLDSDPEKVFLATESYSVSGVGTHVSVVLCDAFEFTEKLNEKFDFIFLDCSKEFYLPLLDNILTMLDPGGLLIADNIFSHSSELKSYVDTVQNHPQLVSVSVGIGSGEEMSLKV